MDSSTLRARRCGPGTWFATGTAFGCLYTRCANRKRCDPPTNVRPSLLPARCKHSLLLLSAAVTLHTSVRTPPPLARAARSTPLIKQVPVPRPRPRFVCHRYRGRIARPLEQDHALIAALYFSTGKVRAPACLAIEQLFHRARPELAQGTTKAA